MQDFTKNYTSQIDKCSFQQSNKNNPMNNHRMFTCISYSSTSQVESIQEKQCDKFTLLSVFQLTDMKDNQQVLTTRKGLTNASDGGYHHI